MCSCSSWYVLKSKKSSLYCDGFFGLTSKIEYPDQIYKYVGKDPLMGENVDMIPVFIHSVRKPSVVLVNKVLNYWK